MKPGSHFRSFWTWDGSTPSTASTGRFAGNATFSNGYPGESLSLKVSDFAGAASVTLKYVALSKNAEVANSSAVENATAAIQATPLLRPLLTPDSGSLSGGDMIVMTLDITGAQTRQRAQ